MAQHYADVHDTARHPNLMHIAEAEQEVVLNWVPHKAKKKNQGKAPPFLSPLPPPPLFPRAPRLVCEKNS